MWTKGLVEILGDRDTTEGKFVVAATDIGPGLYLALRNGSMRPFYQEK